MPTVRNHPSLPMIVHPIVLQVLPSMNHGGVEVVTFETAQALAALGKPTYVTSSGGLLLQRPHHFTHISLPLASKNPLRILLNAYHLARVIQKHGIHLVHARSRAPGWSAWLACKLTGTPFITTYHAAYKHRGLLKKLYNAVMAKGTRVIAISRFIEGHVKTHYPRARVHLIYEGIDLTFFQRRTTRVISKNDEPNTTHPLHSAQSCTLFIPSRLSPTKGISVALHALKALLPTHPHIQLMLIRTGKSSYIDVIDRLIAHLFLQQQVMFLDPTSDLRPYYEMADIVLMTSIIPEALGRISIEALAMECLLIATDCGANPEICLDGHTGFLVSPGNVEHLTQRIKDCLSLTDSEKTILYQKGKHHVARYFSHKTMFDHTLTLYRDVIKNPAGRLEP